MSSSKCCRIEDAPSEDSETCQRLMEKIEGKTDECKYEVIEEEGEVEEEEEGEEGYGDGDDDDDGEEEEDDSDGDEEDDDDYPIEVNLNIRFPDLGQENEKPAPVSNQRTKDFFFGAATYAFGLTLFSTFATCALTVIAHVI